MKATVHISVVVVLLLLSFSLRAEAQSQTIFTSQAPAWVNQSQGANLNYEVGIGFESKAAGQITAIRFWKDSREIGTHTGHIWSASGQLLASVTFTSESASRWQQQSLSSPLSIAANTGYVVSVNTAGSYYVMTEYGLASAVVNQDLSTIVGNNGLYGGVGRFPTTTWNHSNYFRDVVFVPSSQGVTFSISGSVSPAAGGSGAAVSLSGGASESTTISSSGTYSFSNLTAGSYTVTLSKSGYTFSPTGQSVRVTNSNVTGVNFTDSSVSSTFTISGTISGSGGSGATVALSGAASATTKANSSGAYSFTGLSNGTYAVTPSNSGFGFSPTVQSVTVKGANATVPVFTATAVAVTYSISGTISPAPSGSVGYTVTLTPNNVAVTTNASGQYSFTGLPAGTYTATPSASGYSFTPASQTGTISASQTGVNFTATATSSSNVIFDDEFTEASLNSNWYAMNKFGDSGNGEVQCYTPGQDTISGGYLVIASAAQSVTCGQNGSSSSSYNSGMVSWSTFNFTYGTVEFRARMAGGQGPWPAIWLLGYHCEPTNGFWSAAAGSCNWPAPGSDEIDITEILNSNHTAINQELHSNGHNDGCTGTTTDVSQNFHVYQFIWSVGSMVWKIDGTTTCTITQSYVPNTPMFLIINTAMGGSGGSISNSTLPQTMQIDYVKVTQP